MLKTESLQKVCEELGQYHMFDTEAVSRFKSHPEFDSKKPLELQSYVQTFAKIWLDLGFEHIMNFYPSLNVKEFPLENLPAKPYNFQVAWPGRVYVFNRSCHRPIALYDRIVTVKEVPTIAKVLTTRRLKNKRKDNASLKYQLELSTVRKIRGPLETALKTRVGYIVCIAKDEYKKNVERKYKEFTEYEKKRRIVSAFLYGEKRISRACSGYCA